MVGLPTIAGRIACVLAAALLLCASSAHGQVIEEGGFPVKGGGVSGEPFSLSCPPRLYVAAGESVLFSCSATAVPEEGVRYEWESLSGEGLHLLSASDELSPLFTAPVSGESAEYVYRLTAMSVGVYETATVTVSVEVVSGETVSAPVVQEECDSFGGFGRDREGCHPWEKAPWPDSFGGLPEDEGIVPWPSFPESPGAEEKEFAGSSGAGPFPQTPPYLDCPVAVFLEELETGAIECHVSDASGEEYLEYSWEPVGSTTRDYLDNPRLIPEDAPNPSVVAPEAPVYETLESFHSGETTFRYRYRLTATSRATGLSSSSEVEVFVSSSRPSVYCPLEVVVEEGSTAQLDCEGADPLSHRMDYDEEEASVLWEWEGLWGTSTAHLDATDRSSPLFTAPPGSSGEAYHYIASMTSQASGVSRTARRRVTVTVTEAGEEAVVGAVAGSDTAAPARGGPAADLQVTCNGAIYRPLSALDNYYFYDVLDTADDFELDCEATGGPAGAAYTYSWTGPSDISDFLSATDIGNPVFRVPDLAPGVFFQDIFTLLVEASAGSVTDMAEANVGVAVVDENKIFFSYVASYFVDEGDPGFIMDIILVGNDRGGFSYSWRGSPEALARLSATDILTPRFSVPDDVPADTDYDYVVRITRYSQPFTDVPTTVTVRDVPTPVITCQDANLLDDHGAYVLDCSVRDEPSGATYSWVGRGSTGNTARLIAGTDSLTPTFSAPDVIPSSPQDTEKTYEYTVMLEAEGIDGVTADITITVEDKDLICWISETSMLLDHTIHTVNEGASDYAFRTCEGGITSPGGPPYTYKWTYIGPSALGSAAELLTATDQPNVSFKVPGNLPRDTWYEFNFSVFRASDPGNKDKSSFKIEVKNLDPVACNDPPDYVYEGSEPFALDCTDTGALSGVTWVWDPTDHLTNTGAVAPTFTPPEIDEETQDFPYTVTAMVGGADMGGSNVTVRVLRKARLYVGCPNRGFYEAYEGADDFMLDCEANGAGDGSNYDFEWTPRGSTTNTDLLSPSRNTGTRSQPVFSVPDNVDADETYEYTLTASQDNAVEGVHDVTVTVWNKPDIVIDCPGDPYSAYEGEGNIVLDCEATGAPEGSTYDYTWTARGTTSNTNKLIAGTNGPTPTFEVLGSVNSNKTYEYTLTVSAKNAETMTEDVTVTVLNKSDITVTCPGDPYSKYEGEDNFDLDCSATGKPEGSEYDYVWTGRGSTPNTDKLIAGTDGPTPTFEVPEEVDSEETYEYTLTVSAGRGVKENVANVIVTVKKKPEIMVPCPGDPYSAYEGADNIVLDCSASGGPSGSDYTYVWTVRGSTPNTDKLIAGTDGPTPTFEVPGSVNSDETYEYTLTVSAENAEEASVPVTVTVLNKPSITVTCPGHPYSAYEGEGDILLDCEATGKPSDSEYDYVWTGRGSTVVPGRLSSTTIAQPTFEVLGSVNSDKTYEYTLTVSAENAAEGVANVTVRVLNKEPLALVCTPVAPVYEGAADFDLDCVASGAPEGSEYDYMWTGRGSTVVPGRLSSTTIAKPTFDVPRNVNADTDYEYTLTVSARGANPETANVTVQVLNKAPLALVCTPPAPVYEGSEDFDLDCVASGAPEGSEYDYVWTGRGSTVVPGRLSSTTIAKPTFDVPRNVNADTDYEYTLTASAENAGNATANVTVRVLNKPSLTLVCTPPAPVYEGAADFDLDCVASGAPSGSTYDYVWTARGATPNTDKLSSTTIAKPTFDVPEEVDRDETYRYTLTASAENAEDASANVTVRVLNKEPLALICTPPTSVYEGSPDFALDCSASGAPQGSEYDYEWTARGTTPNTDKLSSTTIAKPTFDVPGSVNSNEIYEYTLTASAENAENATANVTVRVLNKPSLALVCTPVAPVYEGAEDFDLDCVASGAPSGSTYDYVWTARGATPNTDKLSSTTVAKPTFDVPEEVDRDETYRYTLTASAENAEDASANVTVRVLNKEPLALICTPVAPVYEGAEDFALDCTASGVPVGSDYEYVWTGRGSTVVPGKLSSTTIAKPTFDVPEEVDRDETYEYTLTASAENAEDATANVTVRVLNTPSLALVCTPVAPVYEGSEDFALDCSILGDTGDTDYTYEWTARGATSNTDLLIAGTDGPTPTFAVPDALDRATTYEYLLTVSADNAEDASANVTVRVLNKEPLALICTPPTPVYEGSADFDLDCSASGAPSGSTYDYVWTARGTTPNTDKLSSTTIAKPTFDVPEEVDRDERYRYTLTASAENAEDVSANVTVRVLNKEPLALICTPPTPVYEGSPDFALDCSASGAPQGSEYDYEWTPRGSTVVPGRLSSTTIAKPTFDVPEEVDGDEIYEYTLTASAENAGNATASVTVRVLNKATLTLVCTSPPPVYEGSPDFAFDCSASGAPQGSEYDYVWTARGATPNTDKLSSTTIAKPTFDVPEEVDRDERYRYTLTASAENAEDVSANVTVRVLNKEPLALICTPPTPVYEGSTDIALDCSASGAPSGSTYDYVWTARGATPNTDKLSSTTVAKPTFDVPEEVDRNETYEYTLTVSADHAESATEDVTVTVLNKEALDVVCATPSPVYEGSEDFALDCAATGAPAGSDYTYVWTGRGTTSNTDLLVSGTDGPTPTFDVPEEVGEDKTYEYLLTVSAENAIDATAEVTVTVLKLGSIALICASPPLVYEGSEDFDLDCSVSGDTGDTDYTYEWTARGATANTDLLIAGTDGPTPTFAVPDALDRATTYEYLLTARAENVEDATSEVTVTVLNRGTLDVACVPPPLVYEGAEDFALDCTASGAPVGSEYEYVWTARGSTVNTDLLTSGTDGPTPTFDVPDALDRATTYEYLLTASAENAEPASAAVAVTVLNRGALSVVCVDPPSIYEGSADITLDCSASGAPAGSEYTYAWTARGSTANTDLLIAGTDGPTPTFDVPDEVDETTTYEYLLTVSADNAEDGAAEVTVTVLNHGALSVVCADPPSIYEGSEDFALDCSASGAPAGSEYTYAWTARGSTANTDLLIAGTDGPTPMFAVPDALDRATTYEYLLTASAENAESGSAEVTVTVLNHGALRVVCADPPSIYEGSEDFALDCSASGAPAGSEYTYAWTARGSTANTDLLIAGTDSPTPTFAVPEELDRTTTYEYLLTVSADNAEDGAAEVTVTVLNHGALSVVCADPPSIYEGSEDFALDCSASGAPAGSEYTYAWTARGSTANTDLLIAGTDGPTPTFAVPEELDRATTYEYLLTASAENAEDGAAEVTVTVLNHGPLSIVCTDPPSVYEGSEDFDLDCSASGAPADSEYTYDWTARGSTANTALLISGTDGPTPTFDVPEDVAATTTYEYLLTASAENAESGSAAVTVTVLNVGSLRVVCADPPSVYEGSEDFALDCSASGAPLGSEYTYDWTARGSTANTDLLIAGTDGPTPTFAVPEELDRATTYEYLLTVSADNAEDGAAAVTVTVLNRGALSVVCADPPSIYEGSEDFALDCSASGAPAGSEYTYAWTARGSTANTDLLIAGTDGPTPTFAVPEELDRATTYEYLLTASAENAESGSAEVTVTVLDRGPLSVVCADPPSIYEGSEDFSFDCSASGAPSGSEYDYAWTARGSTANTDQLSVADISSPTFYVPEEVDEDETYEYLLTASADNAEDGTAELTVTVLNREMLSVTCTDTEVYEGEGDITLDCSASGVPSGSDYTYVWTARGATSNTDLLTSGTDGPTPTFSVPDEVDEDEAYEYMLTVSAENAESGSAAVTVTVLNRGALSVVCADPPSIYEGSEDFALDCSASGAPAGSEYTYAWTARGSTANTDLLIAGTDGPTPTFDVPEDVAATTTYEYLLTASAENAESDSAEVTVNVLGLPLAFVDDSIAGRVYVFTVGEAIEDILLPEATGGLLPYTHILTPLLPRGLSLTTAGDPTWTISGTPLEVSPRTEYTWQVVDANAETVQIAFFIEVVPAVDTTSPPVAETSSELPEPSSLGVTVSASSLRFGVQSAQTQVSLDPMTDGISTRVSGPYHAGRMTLSPGGSEALDENGEMDLSIELASPVVLRREGGIEAASIVLSPSWSLAESCEQLSSQTIGSLYTEVTLSEDACRLLRFGGELDLTGVPSGHYAGTMDVVLRSGESEETHTVDVEVTVVPAQRVITIGPGGVRFSTSRELPAGLTEEQNMSIYPHVAFLTEEKPHGVFELSNPSLIPLEISVSARFGYTEATENGREVVVEDVSESHLGDLSQVVDIHPGVLVLMPGEKGLVRYGMQEGALATMAEKGYAAFFDVVSEPRQYVRLDQMPEEVSGDRTARVTMRVPGVYVLGEGASQLRAALLSISYVGSLSATFLLETQDHPFVGEVLAYDGEGRELGRRETLVYTRSRVRIPLDRMPEEGAVFLRFAPRGSGRVPESATVEWDAPRRDIGDAGNKDGAATTETLVQKP